MTGLAFLGGAIYTGFLVHKKLYGHAATCALITLCNLALWITTL